MSLTFVQCYGEGKITDLDLTWFVKMHRY